MTLQQSNLWTNVAIGSIPLVTGMIAGAICPVGREAASEIRARPPGVAFSIVWPLLYIAMGVAWVRARSAPSSRRSVDVLFGVLVGTLVLWQLIYGCKKDKRGALYVLVLGIAAALSTTIYTARLDSSTSWLLSPLVAWLIFATMLNFEQVNRE